MASTWARRSCRVSRRAALLAGLFVTSLALRPQVSAIGPLVPDIQSNLRVSHAITGLLATIPVICMSLFAPPARSVAARLGPRAVLAGCLALIGLFGVARAAVPPALAVVLLTLPVGVGMGVAGALLPAIVKEHFADRPAFATGVYATGMQLGATVTAAAAVPLAHATGGWRGSLGLVSFATLGLGAAWLALSAGSGRPVRGAAASVRLPVASRVAWLVAAVFGMQSLVYYGVTTWLPDVYVERGWSEQRAGLLLAVVHGLGIPAGFVVPWFADRLGGRRRYVAAAAATMLIGVLGVQFVEGGAWLWAVLLGVAQGVGFSLVLTLPLDVGDRPAEVAAVAALMLGAGYVLSATAPFLLGWSRDATGSFSLTLWLLAASAGGMLAVALALTPERLRRGIRAG